MEQFFSEQQRRNFLLEAEKSPDYNREEVRQTLAAMRAETDAEIKRLGGIPRRERGWAPVNAESNDLYQFRMASVFYEKYPQRRGTYLLYYRNPKDVGGLRAFGVNRALETLQNFQFDPEFLLRLLQEKKITEGLYTKLLELSHLDIHVKSVADGEFVGPNTPLMIIEGPLWQVQLVETVLLQCLDYASGVATRMNALLAISEKPVIDFGARRSPGEEAATISALASAANGAVGVANTNIPEIAERYGMKGVVDIGTTAHAFTEAYLQFDAEGNCVDNPALNELEAYMDYTEIFPSVPVVLIDTIKKEVGIKTAAKIYKERELDIIGVRDDSDISGKGVIEIFDQLKALGVENFFIVISDDLKPARVQEIRDEIEGLRGEEFYEQLDLRLGVGTYLARPEPVGMVFKLAEWEEDGKKHRVSKASALIEKASFPVVYTYRDPGQFADTNYLPEEDVPEHLIPLQREVDLLRGDFAKVFRTDPNTVPKKFLLKKEVLSPVFSHRAEQIRSQIQQNLKMAS